MGNLLLPTDPEWKKLTTWGDPYKKGLTPKSARENILKEREENPGNFKYATSMIVHSPETWLKNAQMSGQNNIMGNPMWFSPLHTAQNWQIASKRREVYMWARFFLENEPKVAAGVKFYSQFSVNGFKLECHNRKILAFYEHKVVKRLRIMHNLKMIAAEFFTLGDVFIHKNISCPHCNGTSQDPETGELCKHPDGIIDRLIILNPDWIEVQQNVLADEPAIVMMPDEEMKRIIFYKQPKQIYDRIPDSVKKLVIENKPIPLSNRTINHLKHMPIPYGAYGTSLIRCLFTTLAYKTKLMTANWIVAERLILPIRLVKVGSDNRPATSADISDMQQQLAATSNEPNLFIVTHHNVEYDFVGASGKILQVTQEMEFVSKEILDGLMLNQALLSGEGPTYSNANVGIETIIRRLEAFRTTLSEYVEEEIFKPIAEMQGFIDKEKSEDLGETVYLYPTIKWNDLNIKDKSQYHQILLQLHDKQVISTQTLMEEFDLNYDQEIKRMRYEQLNAPAMQQQGGAGGGPPGGGGMGGGGGGGAPPGGPDAGMPLGPDMAGGMGGGAGGMPGGDMGGGAPAGGAGGPMAGAGGKIMKKGKHSDKQEQQAPVPPLKLTKIEQKMAELLLGVTGNLKLASSNVRAQYPVENPRGGKPFMIDFALPKIKLGVEADGEIYHSGPEQEQDDKERDSLLAQRGWTILRFDDRIIEDSPQAVEQTVSQHIQTLLRNKTAKVASLQDDMIEYGISKLFTFRNGSVVNLEDNYEDYFENKKTYTASFDVQ